MRGRVQIERGDLASAAQDVDRAMALARWGHPGVLAVRARLRLERGEEDAALADIEQALERDRWDPELYDLRGRVYASKGEVAKAESDFTRCLELAPGPDTEARVRERLKAVRARER